MKTNVLFVCIHNSARSQMAEAFLNALCGSRVQAHSAGLTPGTLNPVVVESMRLRGIDISHHSPKSVEDMLQRRIEFEYVITVCDESSAEACPHFPGAGKRLHWNFNDPSKFTGSQSERLSQVAVVRDAIESRIRTWCSEVCNS